MKGGGEKREGEGDPFRDIAEKEKRREGIPYRVEDSEESGKE